MPKVDMADTGVMANTANILAQCRNEADTRLAEAGRNSAGRDREHIEAGAARKWSGGYRAGRAWNGGYWNGGYWNGGSRFIFIGGLGYPYNWGWYPYWGWRYPYLYSYYSYYPYSYYPSYGYKYDDCTASRRRYFYP